MNFFTHRLKIYDPGDRMTLTDEGERTGFDRSILRTLVVPISSRSTEFIRFVITLGVPTAFFLHIGCSDSGSVSSGNIGDDVSHLHESHSHPF